MPASKDNSDAQSGLLYIVSTPIGNLADMSVRAIEVLKQVDLILAEDTRHSRPLLNHYGITTSLKACHEHNESDLLSWVVAELQSGQSMALISDAGTPLISDPGFVLVRGLRAAGLSVQVVPGASSVIAALSVAGLPTDRFIFDGFLPAKASARKGALQAYLSETRTIAVLESSHRIEDSLDDVAQVLGPEREIVVARELTKKFETVIAGSASEVAQIVRDDPNQQKGEFVVLIAGKPELSDADAEEQELLRIVLLLAEELPLKQAASLAAKITGHKKNRAYELALDARR